MGSLYRFLNERTKKVVKEGLQKLNTKNLLAPGIGDIINIDPNDPTKGTLPDGTVVNVFKQGLVGSNVEQGIKLSTGNYLVQKQYTPPGLIEGGATGYLILVDQPGSKNRKFFLQKVGSTNLYPIPTSSLPTGFAGTVKFSYDGKSIILGNITAGGVMNGGSSNPFRATISSSDATILANYSVLENFSLNSDTLTLSFTLSTGSIDIKSYFPFAAVPPNTAGPCGSISKSCSTTIGSCSYSRSRTYASQTTQSNVDTWTQQFYYSFVLSRNPSSLGPRFLVDFVVEYVGTRTKTSTWCWYTAISNREVSGGPGIYSECSYSLSCTQTSCGGFVTCIENFNDGGTGITAVGYLGAICSSDCTIILTPEETACLADTGDTTSTNSQGVWILSTINNTAVSIKHELSTASLYGLPGSPSFTEKKTIQGFDGNTVASRLINNTTGGNDLFLYSPYDTLKQSIALPNSVPYTPTNAFTFNQDQFWSRDSNADWADYIYARDILKPETSNKFLGFHYTDLSNPDLYAFYLREYSISNSTSVSRSFSRISTTVGKPSPNQFLVIEDVSLRR